VRNDRLTLNLTRECVRRVGSAGKNRSQPLTDCLRNRKCRLLSHVHVLCCVPQQLLVNIGRVDFYLRGVLR